MKKGFIALIALLVLLLGLPRALGGLAQNELEAQLGIYDANPVFALTIADYDRGWFQSTVRYELGFTDEYLKMIKGAIEDSDQPGGELDRFALEVLAPFELVSHISHGPVGLLDGPFVGLYKATTTEGENNPRVQEFLADANMPYLIRGTSTTSLFGNTAFRFEMPATRTKDRDPAADSLAAKLNFSGATGSGNYAALTGEGGRIELMGNVDLLSIADEGSEFALNKLAFNADQTLIGSMTGIGPLKASIGSLIIKDLTGEEPLNLAVQGMLFDLDSNYGSSRDTLNVLASYRVEELSFDAQTVSEIEVTVAMKELSIDALQKYNEWSQNLAFVEIEDEAEWADMMATAVPFLHEFLDNSPTLNVAPAKLIVGGEPIRANLAINIDGSELPDADDFDAQDTAMWLKILGGEASLSLSEQMATLLAVTSAQNQLQAAFGDQQEIPREQINQMAVAQAPILLQTLVQQGMLLSENNQISAAVSFANGELQLNGKPIPLDALLGL